MAQTAFDLDLSSFEDIASGSYDLDRQTSGGAAVDSNVAGIFQIGTNNIDLGSVAEIHQTGGLGNRAMIWQSGYNHSALIQQTEGENNTARLAQVGSGHYANLIQTDGSNNVMTVQMLGQNARIEASQVDATDSVLTVIMNSGSQLMITQTGSGNLFSTSLGPNVSLTVTQTGQ